MHEDGKIKLNQLMNTTALGAVSGSFWGLLIGAIFLMPVFGAAIGAASGALGGALTDYGVNDGFMKELSSSLQPGNAALFVLVRKMTGDKVLEAIKGTGGVVLKTSLDHTREQALRDAISAAPGRGRTSLDARRRARDGRARPRPWADHAEPSPSCSPLWRASTS